MLQSLIPFFYVSVIGYAAFHLMRVVFPADNAATRTYFPLFLFINFTGFVIAGFVLSSTFAFSVLTGSAILFCAPKAPAYRIALFLFLLPILPMLEHDLQIGSQPIIHLTWPRLLIIVLLLPIFFKAIRSKPLLHFPTDKYVWFLIAVNAVLAFRDTSVTNGMRHVIYVVLEILVPYIVITRSIRSLDDIRIGIFALLSALVFVAFTNIFEAARAWNIYPQLVQQITGYGTFFFDDRQGIRRAYGPLDRPSQASLALAVATGLLWMLLPYARRRLLYLATVLLVCTGLLVTFSRGGWIAAALIGLGYVMTSFRKQAFKVFILCGIVMIPLSLLPIASDIKRMLPFVGEAGTHEAQTVEFRKELFAASIRIAHERPLLGSTDYTAHPGFDHLRTPSGFIDVVNHYAVVLLSTGYVGLGAFLAVFLSALFHLHRQRRRCNEHDFEMKAFLTSAQFTILGAMLSFATTTAGRGQLILMCLVAFVLASSNTDFSQSPLGNRAKSRRKLPRQGDSL